MNTEREYGEPGNASLNYFSLICVVPSLLILVVGLWDVQKQDLWADCISNTHMYLYSHVPSLLRRLATLELTIIDKYD